MGIYHAKLNELQSVPHLFVQHKRERHVRADAGKSRGGTLVETACINKGSVKCHIHLQTTNEGPAALLPCQLRAVEAVAVLGAGVQALHSLVR